MKASVASQQLWSSKYSIGVKTHSVSSFVIACLCCHTNELASRFESSRSLPWSWSDQQVSRSSTIWPPLRFMPRFHHDTSTSPTTILGLERHEARLKSNRDDMHLLATRKRRCATNISTVTMTDNRCCFCHHGTI
jgi:hypothetical protein